MNRVFPDSPKLSELWKQIREKCDELLGVESIADEENVTDEQENWTDRFHQKKWIAAAVLIPMVLFFGGLAAYFLPDSNRLADSERIIYLHVRPGADARSIAASLEEEGIIGNQHRFFWYAKLNGVANDFKTGTYTFHGNMDTDEVIDKLLIGENAMVKFTIPEGFGVKEIAERLSEMGIADEKEFLKLAKDFAPYRYMKKQKDVRYAAEGFLFPDTYTIDADMDTESIMRMMAQDLDARLTEELRRRAEREDLSIYELITLASLVEKEARYDEDRPIIAQVFFKRLELGMPLQTDASLQYLLDEPKEDVTIADTKIDSPYNTYQHAGLPPGPIASPGMAAIEAVLYPADTDYLYFVADRDGHNHYSHTYARHLELVDEVR